MTSRTELELTETLHELTDSQPFSINAEALTRRSRNERRRTLGLQGGLGLAAVAAISFVAISGGGNGAQSSVAPIASPATSSLLQLASSISSSASTRSGDATLVVRQQHYPGQATIPGYDLYGDNGTYYWSPKKDGLPGEVAANNSRADGLFARETAAARYAATGDVQEARKRMANAASPDGNGPSATPVPKAEVRAAAEAKARKLGVPYEETNLEDNWVWGNSYDALVSGAGDPAVRAGVLRILSTVKDVAVTNGTVNGQSVLLLTASGAVFGGGYTEQLAIDSTSGIPVQFTNGDGSIHIDYTVSRVTLADVKAGKTGL